MATDEIAKRFEKCPACNTTLLREKHCKSTNCPWWRCINPACNTFGSSATGRWLTGSQREKNAE